MTRLAVAAAVLAVVVLLAAPGTPGERPSAESSGFVARSSASVSAVIGSSLGASLAADHNDRGAPKDAPSCAARGRDSSRFLRGRSLLAGALDQVHLTAEMGEPCPVRNRLVGRADERLSFLDQLPAPLAFLPVQITLSLPIHDRVGHLEPPRSRNRDNTIVSNESSRPSPATDADPPVQTITITQPPKPKPRRHDRSPAATIRRISRHVFHARWRTAACIARYESTDGLYLYNGPNLGPWQINTAAHPWTDARRLVHDWWYSARVAYRISDGGSDWSPWATHARCGV